MAGGSLLNPQGDDAFSRPIRTTFQLFLHLLTNQPIQRVVWPLPAAWTSTEESQVRGGGHDQQHPPAPNIHHPVLISNNGCSSSGLTIKCSCLVDSGVHQTSPDYSLALPWTEPIFKQCSFELKHGEPFTPQHGWTRHRHRTCRRFSRPRQSVWLVMSCGMVLMVRCCGSGWHWLWIIVVWKYSWGPSAFGDWWCDWHF